MLIPISLIRVFLILKAMRKTLSFLFWISFFSISADTVIIMEEYNGVYRVPCMVNGAKMKFIFDTGATNVCLSLSMAEYLLDNGYIDKEDIQGKGSSQVADGRIVDHIGINIKDIQIGELHLVNVEAVVVEEQNAPLLLGQSAIKKLGSYEIKGNQLIVHNDSKNTLYDKALDLSILADEARTDGLYEKAMSYFDQIYAMDKSLLLDYEIYEYARCCCLSKKYTKAINILDDIKDYNKFVEDSIDIYQLYSTCYFGIEDYKNSIKYSELSKNKIHHTDEELSNIYSDIADCYFFMERYNEAGQNYGDAMSVLISKFNVSQKYIMDDCFNKLKKGQKSYRTDRIDHLMYLMLRCKYKAGDVSTMVFYRTMNSLVKAKNRYAQQFFNEIGMDSFLFEE